jgi:hypothetical protein
MSHGHLDYFQKSPLGGRPDTKPMGDHGTPHAHNRWFILLYHVWGPSLKWHLVEGPVTYDFTLHSWSMTTLHDFQGVLDGLWSLSFRLSQFQRSWLLAHVWSGPKEFWHCASSSIKWHWIPQTLQYISNGVIDRGEGRRTLRSKRKCICFQYENFMTVSIYSKTQCGIIFVMWNLIEEKRKFMLSNNS